MNYSFTTVGNNGQVIATWTDENVCIGQIELESSAKAFDLAIIISNAYHAGLSRGRKNACAEIAAQVDRSRNG